MRYPWKEEKEEEDPGLPQNQNRKNHPHHHHRKMVVLVVLVEVVMVVVSTGIPCPRTRRRVRATFFECYGILPFCSSGTLPVEVGLSCNSVSVPVNFCIFLAYFPPF